MAAKFFKSLGKIAKGALPVLKGIAPMAAGALSGPYAPVVMSTLKGLLGDTSMSDDAALQMVAQQSPDTLLKIKELDAQVEIARMEAGINREAMEYGDVADARERQERTGDREPARLTYISMLVVGLLVGLVIWQGEDLPVYVAGIIGIVVGEFLAAMQKGFNFHLGSSSGSKNKDDKIERLISGLSQQDDAAQPE
jgi:hypothetical protein